MEQGLALYHSNDLDALAAAFQRRLADYPRTSLLAPTPVVVPHRGLGRWLGLWLADRCGIAANLDFMLPGEFVWRTLRALEPAIPDELGLDAETLQWRLHRLLVDPALLEQPELAPVRHYLAPGDDLELRRLQLARGLAGCYSRYLLARPDWIEAWSAGARPAGLEADDAALWQGLLWRACDQQMRAEAGLGLGEAAAALRRATRDLQLHEDRLPPAVLAFGISQLPPLFLDYLLALANYRPLHLFFLNACSHYWEPGVAERVRLRHEVRALRRGEQPQEVLFDIGNPLLAATGRQGGEFLQLLFTSGVADNLPEVEEPGYPLGERGTLLGALQRSLRDLEPEIDPVVGGDESIQFHACHSPLREVQVLHDRLVRLLADDAGLKPRDVLVLAPDIGVYAPYVRAVFGSATHTIRYNISDRSAVDEHPIVAVFRDLLGLPAMPLDVPSVVAILETPPVARRLGLDPEQLADLRQWIADTGIRWGLDGDHRAAMGAGETDLNSWAHGLERMLLGAAVDRDDVLVADRVLPYSQIEGRGAEAAGNLAWFIRHLGRLRAAMSSPRGIEDWTRLLTRDLFEALFQPAPDDDDERRAADHVLAALDRLRRSAAAAGSEVPIPWSAMREALEPLLADTPARQAFLSGGVTFASMVPMRSVPARVVCLLGLNDGDFPRRSRPPQFDLMARHPRVGDRSPVEDDRYLFLEALISARDVLYLSHVGRGINDGEPREPSPLVKELLSFINHGRQRVTMVQHPLQPFSIHAYDPSQPATQSADPAWLPAATAVTAPLADEPRFTEPAAPAATAATANEALEPIDINDLVRFFRNPARAWLEAHCALYLKDYSPELDGKDPLEADGLSAWHLRRRLVERALENAGEMPPGLPDRRFLAAGDVPPGSVGRQLVADWAAALAPFARRVHRIEHQLGPAERVPVATQVATGEGPVQVSGMLPLRAGSQLFSWVPSSLHKVGRILPPLVSHLLLSTRGDDGESVALGLSGDPAAADRLRLCGFDGGPWLADLVALYRRGQRSPLPLFSATAYAWVAARTHKPRSAERLLREAWQGSYSGPPGECSDPHIALLTRGWTEDELFGDDFRDTALKVFGPLFELEGAVGLGQEKLT